MNEKQSVVLQGYDWLAEDVKIAATVKFCVCPSNTNVKIKGASLHKFKSM